MCFLLLVLTVLVMLINVYLQAMQNKQRVSSANVGKD